MLRGLFALTLALAALPAGGAAADPWADVLAEARGQTVYWNAWGGDEQINAYIAWVGDQVRQRYGVDVITSSSPTPPRRSRAWSPRRRPGGPRAARST